MSRRIAVVLSVLLLVLPLSGKSLVKTGIDKEAAKLRPLKELFHALKSAERIKVYSAALALFEKKLQKMGVSLSKADRKYWEKSIAPIMMKKGDLTGGSSDKVFIAGLFRALEQLMREVIGILRSANGDVTDCLAALRKYKKSKLSHLLSLQKKIRRLSVIVKKKDMQIVVMKQLQPFMKLSGDLKRASRPYQHNSEFKKLLRSITNPGR